MSDEPKMPLPDLPKEHDCSIIDTVLPAIGDGVAARLMALCGAPVTLGLHVIDVNGDVHAISNFATQPDFHMFLEAIVEENRRQAELSLREQRIAAVQAERETKQ